LTTSTLLEIKMIRSLVRTAAAGALLLSVTPAFAHITLETGEAPVGSTYKAVLRVPHGCDGNATTAVRVRIPEGLVSVKPMPKAGWELSTVKGPYQNTYELHGSKVTEGVTEITWSGGNLPDEFYDEFVFRGSLAETLAAGTTLYFPVIQTCASGEEAWIEIPAEGQPEPELPAPGLQLLEATP
jgi:uncharacterized protein YcnI